MHRCLLFPGIYTHILEFVNLHFADDNPMHSYHQFGETNPTLAALAGTCKVFLEPTLNVLWRTQRTLAPIIRTLPETAWSEELIGWEVRDLPYYRLHLNRPPTASEWSRFDYYAPRIRDLGCFRWEFSDFEKYILWGSSGTLLRYVVTHRSMAILCSSRRRHVLFPNLTNLRWNMDDIGASYSLPAFFSSTLTTLCISVNTTTPPGMHDTLAMQVAALLAKCPSVTRFETWGIHPDTFIDAAIKFAYDCPRLESFVMRGNYWWSIELLEHLARQPFLRKVRLAILGEIAADLQFLHDATLHYPFPSLQKLWLTVPTLAPCLELIRLMHTCAFHTFDVECLEKIGRLEVAELFYTLRVHCALDTLQVVQVTNPFDGKWTPSVEDLTNKEAYFVLDDLWPLFDFPNMRVFMIELHLPYHFDNDTLFYLADAWPLLVDLRLGSYSFYSDTWITWAGLAYLLWKCPQLIFVCVAWDARSDDIELVTADPQFRPNRALRLLWAENSILGPGHDTDVERFANLLFSIAPKIQSLNGFAHEDPTLDIVAPADTNAFYSQVESIMWELRRTRMREEFGFLDAYVTNEADMMNDFAVGRPVLQFPYVRTGTLEGHSLI